MASTAAERIAAIAAAEYESESLRIKRNIERSRELNEANKKRKSPPSAPSSDSFHKKPQTTLSNPRSDLSDFRDERRRPTSSKQQVHTPVAPQGPAWYQKLKFEATRDKSQSDADIKMNSLKSCIRDCKRNPKADHTSAFKQIRDVLHAIAFIPVTAQLLRNQLIFHNTSGLQQIFQAEHSGGVNWPFDIKADAEELYNKWSREVFETDIMLGLIPGKAKRKGWKDNVATEGTPTQLDREYKGRINSNYFGNGRLINGQWWPIWLAVLRDGAHGSAMAGIHGDSQQGAFSCVLSGGRDYEDEDHGDWLWYCGTDSSNGSPTEATKLLLMNEVNEQPVRLLRSHEAAWKSKHAPEKGLRYDGLYSVTAHELVDPAHSTRQRHRFRLERLPNQDPIRAGGPEVRPTKEELNAYYTDKVARGFA